MTKEELITKQQLKIENLKEKLLLYHKRDRMIHAVLFNTGAPLNDNKLQYSRAQLVPFGSIAHLLDL